VPFEDRADDLTDRRAVVYDENALHGGRRLAAIPGRDDGDPAAKRRSTRE
jgi:hypothetical protein